MKLIVPRYNMKCSGENVIPRGIFHAVSCFPLHFMLYRGNSDSQSIYIKFTEIKETEHRHNYIWKLQNN